MKKKGEKKYRRAIGIEMYAKCFRMTISRKLLLLFFALCISDSMKAQDFLFTDNPEIQNPFRESVLINAQTTITGPKTGWEFHIRHRFGAMATDNTLVKSFLGTDGVANIRFSFVFPLSDKTYVGVGRSKFGKTYDLEVKHRFLTQTVDNKKPISLAAYVNIACMSDAFPPVPKNSYFSDGTTEFEYLFNHRLTYNSQVIISRKMSERTSIEVAPIFIYRNLVEIGKQNASVNIAAGVSFRTSTRASIIAEYTYRFLDQPVKNLFPLALGYEFGTVGHSFQIIVSSSNDLLEQNVYHNQNLDYTQGKFYLGFNLRRTFWHKKKTKIEKL